MLPVRLLDLLGRRVPRHLEQLVVVGGHQPSVSRWRQAPADDGDRRHRLRVVHAGRAEHADGAGRLPLRLVRGDDQRALGQRRHARLGADGDLQAAVEHVAQQGDDDVLLLEDAEHLAHRLEGVERPGDPRGAADEDLVGVVAPLGPQRGERELAHRVGDGVAGRRAAAAGSCAPHRRGAPARWAVAAATRSSPSPSARAGPPSERSTVCFSTAPLDSTATTRLVDGARPTTCTERTVASVVAGLTTTPA